MSNDFYGSMYGARKPEVPSTQAAPIQPEKPKLPAPAYNRLRGLKLTNSHMHEVDLGGPFPVTIPSAAYVKLLEDQIKDFRNVVRQQGDDLRRTNKVVQNLAREIERLKADMALTIKKR